MPDGNRINQGIAEKLYTCVMGISLFFSAFVVALAVQWKLALITMTIVPGMILSVGSCIGLVTPVENELVSSVCVCLASKGSRGLTHLFLRPESILKQDP